MAAAHRRAVDAGNGRSTATPSTEEPFRAEGGFARLNKVFDGELESVLAGINEEMWKRAG